MAPGEPRRSSIGAGAETRTPVRARRAVVWDGEVVPDGARPRTASSPEARFVTARSVPAGADRAPGGMSDRIVCVGTSDAFGARGPAPVGLPLRSGEARRVLLDCGATTVTGLASLGVARKRVDAIADLPLPRAITSAGVPPLPAGRRVSATSAGARSTSPGPRGVEQRVRRPRGALGHPLEDRELRLSRSTSTSCAPGEPRGDGPVRGSRLPTHHAPESHPHGLVCRSGDRRSPTRATPAGSTACRARAPARTSSSASAPSSTGARVPPEPRGAARERRAELPTAAASSSPTSGARCARSATVGGDEARGRRPTSRGSGRGPPTRPPARARSPEHARRGAPVQRGR